MPILRLPTSGDPTTTSSIQLVVDDLYYQASTYYAINIYSSSGTFLQSLHSLGSGGGSSGSYRTVVWTHSGLSAGTQYGYYVNIKHQSTSPLTRVPSSGYFYASTDAPPVVYPPSTPTISKLSENGKTITLRAYISSNTTYVDWDDTRWAGGQYKRVYTYGATYTDKSWTVPSYNTSYMWDVIAYNGSGGSNWSQPYSWLSPPEPSPPAPVNVSVSNIGGTSFHVNISGGAGATSWACEVYSSSSYTGTPVWKQYGNATNIGYVGVTGLKEFTTYYPKVYATNANGNSTPAYTSAKTLDTTLPYVSITNSDGDGRVWFDFSGYDVVPSGAGASGLQGYAVWISARNSTLLPARYDTLYNLTNSYYTFVNDTNGANFVHNSNYTLGVRSVDNSGNMSNLSTVTVTYIRARPNNWNWAYSKVQGNNINVTASEWESLGKAINQFRTYKGLIVRDFTVPNSGDTITASIYNQYRNAISDMSPPISVPSTKTANVSSILASDFNGLTSSLNSIQ